MAIFTPDGNYVSSFPVQGWKSDSIDDKPYLVVGSDNRIYVTDPEGYRVVVFSTDGKPLFVIGQYGPDEGSFGLPNGIGLDPNDGLWIADAGNNRLVHYGATLP